MGTSYGENAPVPGEHSDDGTLSLRANQGNL